MLRATIATEFFLINLTYLIMYTLTLGFIFPLQKIVASEGLSVVGLLFLPHGVRAAAFYYCGTRAILHLLPAAYITWFITVYGSDLELHPIAPLASVLACYGGFAFYNLAIRLNSEPLIKNPWVNLLGLAAVMSVLNGAALTLLNFEGDFLTGVFGYLIGDIAGAFFFLIIALYIYKSIKHLSATIE